MVTMPPPQISLPASASAQRVQFAAAYSVLEQAVSEQAFPGAAFGVLSRGQVLALDGVGGFTYDQPSTPVTASTVFDLASLTKVIATTSMAMLLWQSEANSTWNNRWQSSCRALPGRTRPAALRLPGDTLHVAGACLRPAPGYPRLFAQDWGPRNSLEASLQLAAYSRARQPAGCSDPGFILLGGALET